MQKLQFKNELLYTSITLVYESRPLTIDDIVHHMRNHMPGMYRQLWREGTLFETVYEMEQAVGEEMDSRRERLWRRGLRMQIKDKLELYNYGRDVAPHNCLG
jgi:hypothetical protein